jgi:hypothetical protein
MHCRLLLFNTTRAQDLRTQKHEAHNHMDEDVTDGAVYVTTTTQITKSVTMTIGGRIMS